MRTRARLIPRLRRFGRADEGATALEFALVAAPFCVLMFGLFELALIFVISMTLDNATLQAARTIRTGVLQTTGGATKESFKTAICNNMAWIKQTCLAKLYLDVRTYPSFAAANPPDPVTAQGTFNAGALQFTPGDSNDIVVVKTYLQWPLIAPNINAGLKKLASGHAVITSTAVFSNEPYE